MAKKPSITEVSTYTKCTEALVISVHLYIVYVYVCVSVWVSVCALVHVCVSVYCVCIMHVCRLPIFIHYIICIYVVWVP